MTSVFWSICSHFGDIQRQRMAWPWRTDRQTDVQPIAITCFSIADARKNYGKDKQEGWLSPTERESVSAISLRHILTSTGYTSGTITANVIWMERGFNADQTHRSMYPSTFNRLRAIARYWSEIATFFYPFAFNVPVGGVPIGIPEKKFRSQKTGITGLPGSEDSLTIGWAIMTQYQRVTDRRTDGRTDERTDVQPIVVTCVSLLTHVKNERSESVQTWYGEWSSDILELI